MKTFFRNTQGSTAVEFAVTSIPVMLFIFGIIQLGYIMWASNQLHFAVDTASRCLAVGSTTSPCQTSGTATANTAFLPLTATTWNASACPSGSVGVYGSYQVPLLGVFHVDLQAQSCYPQSS